MLDAETLEIQSSIAFADYKTRLRFDSGYQNDSKWSYDYTDIQKKPFVAISLGPGKRGGRWFVWMKRTASVTPIFDWTLKRTFST